MNDISNQSRVRSLTRQTRDPDHGFTKFSLFFFKKKKYFSPNDTITKINDCKIEHQPKIECFLETTITS